MLVQKFGGSSLSTATNLQVVSEIILKAQTQHKQVGVVLSAMGNTTDKLIDVINLATNNSNYEDPLKTIEQFHFDALKSVNCLCRTVLQAQSTKMNYLFQEARAKLKGISLLKYCPENSYAWLVTLGEHLSVAIVTATLASKINQIETIDARKNLISKEGSSNTAIDVSLSTKNLTKFINSESKVLLMPGFTASDTQGNEITLGRNGSDYSAAILAIGLKATACEIWTDVDGVYNANPKEIKAAQRIPVLSYHEAMELSYFGASILHPKTITPLMQANIPCLIKNTFNPNSEGTLISNKEYSSEHFATAISNLSNISMITVCGPGMKGMVGMAERVFATMSKKDISLILITQSSSEYSISFCIDSNFKQKAEQSLKNEFELELKGGLLEPLQVKDELAIISLISDNMKKRPGTAAQFFNALAIANVNVVAIAQGSNERSISAVIEADRVQRGLKSCHQLFFDSRQQAEIILIGCGLVGDALLQQIKQQQQHLNQKNLSIKVCGIVNSKGAVLDEQGIDIGKYRELLKHQLTTIDREKLKSFRQQSNMINPIIVDCTSSQHIAMAYLDFFKAGYHIVAANKKANTLDIEYYKEIKQTAINLNRQFNYETNVGAGLPVIDTFRNLISAGDSLLKFQGILSGSMSYIFGKLDSGMPLSQAVKKAKHKGFTEPDPRDDLSGMDVARKVLIIAREAGLDLELSDIQVDSLLTEDLLNCKSVDEFMRQLPTIDASIANLNQKAMKNDCVLRFIGTIENKQGSVKIEAVPASSALYSVKAGENAISFHSQYYQPIPMVLRGYGAGADVTAAGIFSDVIKILPSKSSFV